MAAYNKFEQFVEDLGKGVHQLHAAGHTLMIYLSNATPSASLDAVKADLAEIAGGNGYTSGGTDIDNDYTETGGVGTLTAAVDPSWTASGSPIAQFRYPVMYNTTPTSPADPLISWWDYGSAIDLQVGESFSITIGASLFTLT